MPNKYAEKKGWNIPKQKYKVSNWGGYNQSLRRRGDIEIWLSDDAILIRIGLLSYKGYVNRT